MFFDQISVALMGCWSPSKMKNFASLPPERDPPDLLNVAAHFGCSFLPPTNGRYHVGALNDSKNERCYIITTLKPKIHHQYPTQTTTSLPTRTSRPAFDSGEDGKNTKIDPRSDYCTSCSYTILSRRPGLSSAGSTSAYWLVAARNTHGCSPAAPVPAPRCRKCIPSSSVNSCETV